MRRREKGLYFIKILMSMTWCSGPLMYINISVLSIFGYLLLNIFLFTADSSINYSYQHTALFSDYWGTIINFCTWLGWGVVLGFEGEPYQTLWLSTEGWQKKLYDVFRGSLKMIPLNDGIYNTCGGRKILQECFK